jgi:hypothetical protein
VRLGTLECAPDGPINLGNEREVTIAEIADLVLEMTGSSSGVERLPLPQDDPVRRRPDATRARDILEMTMPPMSEGRAKVGPEYPAGRQVTRMTTATEFDTVDEAHALFERRSTEWMGLSRLAFLEALERGDFSGRTDEKPVRDLMALLPFALAE